MSTTSEQTRTTSRQASTANTTTGQTSATSRRTRTTSITSGQTSTTHGQTSSLSIASDMIISESLNAAQGLGVHESIPTC